MAKYGNRRVLTPHVSKLLKPLSFVIKGNN